MKIFFSSYAFRPSVGGIEAVSAILADEFASAGHEIELITEIPGERSRAVGNQEALTAAPQASLARSDPGGISAAGRSRLPSALQGE